MTHDGARGGRFVAGMIAALCAICGLAALFGVPAADGVFLGLGGMLLGMGAARFLLPRRDWGLAGRTALVFLAIGGLFAGYHLSVIGFSTVRGVLLWGLYFGFWSVAVHRLTDPIAPERTGGSRRNAACGIGSSLTALRSWPLGQDQETLAPLTASLYPSAWK